MGLVQSTKAVLPACTGISPCLRPRLCPISSVGRHQLPWSPAAASRAWHASASTVAWPHASYCISKLTPPGCTLWTMPPRLQPPPRCPPLLPHLCWAGLLVQGHPTGCSFAGRFPAPRAQLLSPSKLLPRDLEFAKSQEPHYPHHTGQPATLNVILSGSVSSPPALVPGSFSAAQPQPCRATHRKGERPEPSTREPRPRGEQSKAAGSTGRSALGQNSQQQNCGHSHPIGKPAEASGLTLPRPHSCKANLKGPHAPGGTS